eukprot:g2515.t1
MEAAADCESVAAAAPATSTPGVESDSKASNETATTGTPATTSDSKASNETATTPPRDAASPTLDTERRKGVVKFFSTKGYGFIVQTDETEIFVHSKEIKGNALQTGDEVTFEVGIDTEKNKPVAMSVTGGTGMPMADFVHKGKMFGGKGKFGKDFGGKFQFGKGYFPGAMPPLGGKFGFCDPGFGRQWGFDGGFAPPELMPCFKGGFDDFGGFGKGKGFGNGKKGFGKGFGMPKGFDPIALGAPPIIAPFMGMY